LTLLAAWRSWREADISCTHIWAHPVDLPLVVGETIGLLREVSRRKPDRVIRPQFEGVPGHPVILPGKVLEILDGREEWHDGPLRDFLDWAAAHGRFSAPWAVEVSDRGVRQDFDRPTDLHRPGYSGKDRGNP
jgi:CTP:molybdopterin cytidylyltransferase MocA